LGICWNVACEICADTEMCVLHRVGIALTWGET